MPWKHFTPFDFRTVMAVAAWIGAAHIVSGICILVEPNAILVSAFAGLKWITALYAPGTYISGTALIMIGIMAIAGGSQHFHLPVNERLGLIGPQVVLLVFTLSSIAVALIEGKYPDGYVPIGGTAFITADQSITAIISMFHIMSVLWLPVRVVEAEVHD